jgi:hypothetical protein
VAGLEVEPRGGDVGGFGVGPVVVGHDPFDAGDPGEVKNAAARRMNPAQVSPCSSGRSSSRPAGCGHRPSSGRSRSRSGPSSGRWSCRSGGHGSSSRRRAGSCRASSPPRGPVHRAGSVRSGPRGSCWPGSPHRSASHTRAGRAPGVDAGSGRPSGAAARARGRSSPDHAASRRRSSRTRSSTSAAVRVGVW